VARQSSGTLTHIIMEDVRGATLSSQSGRSKQVTLRLWVRDGGGAISAFYAKQPGIAQNRLYNTPPNVQRRDLRHGGRKKVGKFEAMSTQKQQLVDSANSNDTM